MINTNPDHISRRRVLQGAVGASVAAASVAGCDLFETTPGQTDGPSGKDKPNGAEQKEAPQLARDVAAGRLPHLKDRLPRNPLVVDLVNDTGSYGGTWHLPMSGPDEGAWDDIINYEGLLRWNRDASSWRTVSDENVRPNLAEDYAIERDGRKYVFSLRSGIRWSDGEPFTADDIVFGQNDVLNNTDLFGGGGDAFDVTGGNPIARKINDHTVVFEFREPYGLFGPELAASDGTNVTTKPLHYLKQFHKKYNPKVHELAKSHGHDSWIELFWAKAYDYTSLPVLWPWVLKSKGDNQIVAKRNPYYWKMDPKGRQLPYIDRVQFDLVNNENTLTLKAAHGDYSLLQRGICTPSNKPVLARGRQSGKYSFFDNVRDYMNEAIIMFNLTHKDPEKRKVFLSKDFRVGLSHAINRSEIVKAVFQRQGTPSQAAVRPDDSLYDKGMASQYTEFDPSLAKKYLDKVLPDKNGGTRLGLNGKPFEFIFEIPTEYPDLLNTLTIVKKYWEDVGVSVTVKSESYELWVKRLHNNSLDSLAWIGDTGYSLSTMIEPRYFVSTRNNLFAIGWQGWYENKRQGGVRPPAPMRRQLRLYDELKGTADPEKQSQLLKEILEIARKEFYTIGTVFNGKGYGIVKDNFRNVPEPTVVGWQPVQPGAADPEQFFFSAR